MAQRVMDCGDAGHILLSRRVAEDLEQYRQWSSCLHDLGECEVKHGVRLQLVNLYTDELGNPRMPEKLAKAQAASASTVSDVKRSRLRPVLFFAFLIALAGIATGFYLFSHRSLSNTAGQVTIPDKSIAGLPFENLGDDKSDAYFVSDMRDAADPLHEPLQLPT